MDPKFFFVFIVLIIFHKNVAAQINDDFSDGNLTNNPAWQGNMDMFQVVNEVLQSNGVENQSPIYLSTPNTLLNDIIWKFKIKLNFNPSNNNYVRIYLVSDIINLSTSTLNGYYIRIGENLSDDGIDLFKQSADGSVEKIIDGTAGQVAVKPDVGIKVIRSAAGEWEVMADLNGGDNYTELVGSTTDNEFTSTTFFGVVCNYTNSNTANFLFDDIVVESSIDSAPPEVLSTIAVSEKSLEIIFSESLEATSAQNINNYAVSLGIGMPITATLSTPNKILLVFSSAFSGGTNHTLSINNITDLNSNIIVSANIDFVWNPPVVAAFRDVVINEIFADPNPKVNLPESEFIELYNASSKTISLTNWTFSDPAKSTVFPIVTLDPNQYLIICPQNNVEDFADFENIVGLAPWPTLNNGGDDILLRDETGAIIDSANYMASWYQDVEKVKGGWSLEQISPTTMCNFSQNWSASISSSGGTPGEENSVFDPSPDLLSPIFLTAIATSPDQIQLIFNEVIDKTSAETAVYTISPDVKISDIQIFADTMWAIFITTENNLSPKILYEIRVENISDCAGNIINNTNNSTKFALPEIAKPLDVVINEILFNPRSGGVDFVEIYNRSDKYVDLLNWEIANDKEGSLDNFKIVSKAHLILAPKNFLVFTVNAQILKADYPSGLESVFLETSLPSFPDEKGSVVLLNNEGGAIDFFEYNENYHFSLIKDLNGVSLERINPAAPTNDNNNWHSAASTVGYATPGYLNSQATPNNNLGDNINISPKVFLPDNSGLTDFTTISYHFETNGFIATISIFDVAGRKVKTIAKNDLLPRAGFYTWDGTSDNRTKVSVGYYIVLFEIFNPQGKALKFKKTVAVAGKF